MKFWQILNLILDRFFIVLGAFIGSQIPEFMQQYIQRLAGHVDELKHLINKLNQLAFSSEKSLNEYIQKFIQNGDSDFVKQGEFMQYMLQRWQELNYTLENLLQSSSFLRPFIFLKEMDYSIAQETFYFYQPGINLTWVGGSYTALGVLIGFVFYQILSKVLKIGYQSVIALFRSHH